jgi:hypothetical protein
MLMLQECNAWGQAGFEGRGQRCAVQQLAIAASTEAQAAACRVPAAASAAQHNTPQQQPQQQRWWWW